MQVDLADDRFDITYDPKQLGVDELLGAIRKLEFDPKLVEQQIGARKDLPQRVEVSTLPPEIAALFTEAAKSKKPVLVQFSGPG